MKKNVFAALFVMSACLSACAGRPDASVLRTVDTNVKGGRIVSAYVVSTREQSATDRTDFSSARARSPNYARFDISVPPNHKDGKIEWPSSKADPKTSFVVNRQDMMDKQGFDADLGRIARSGQRIGVFVHGYNYSYQEALFRAAQMAADANLSGVPVVFSWPSQANLSGYVADKESAVYSRDALVETLTDLTRHNPGKPILVFAHSMGGWLVMEATRQLRLKGRNDVISGLQIVLAAPDIDSDVFRKQTEVIGRLSPPLTVLVSKDDRALLASSILGGDVQRIGALDVEDQQVQETADREGVQFIDISNLKASDPVNHDRYASLASLIPKLEASEGRKGNELGRAGAFVLDTIGTTVSSPFHLASRVVSPQ
ncbi:alpha/beta hydrolase [Rhizobium binxianense]